MDNVIVINSELRLPPSEVHYRTARSGGPGGQHVNKTETQVELLFDVAHSPSLNETQRQRILSKLPNIIDSEGMLHLTAQSERSQLRNREMVTARFREVLAAALRVPK
jgi:ribosome-associated protein